MSKKVSIAKIIVIKTKTANLSIKPSRVTLEMFEMMVSSHAAFCMTLFCHARNMSNHHSIFLTHVDQVVVRSMRHLASKRLQQNLDRTGSDHGPDHGSDRITDRVTDRITDQVMLIPIIDFASQVKIKSA